MRLVLATIVALSTGLALSADASARGGVRFHTHGSTHPMMHGPRYSHAGRGLMRPHVGAPQTVRVPPALVPPVFGLTRYGFNRFGPHGFERSGRYHRYGRNGTFCLYGYPCFGDDYYPPYAYAPETSPGPLVIDVQPAAAVPQPLPVANTPSTTECGPVLMHIPSGRNFRPFAACPASSPNVVQANPHPGPKIIRIE